MTDNSRESQDAAQHSDVMRALGQLEGSMRGLHERDARVENRLAQIQQEMQNNHDDMEKRVGALESFKSNIVGVVGTLSAIVGAGVTLTLNWLLKGK